MTMQNSSIKKILFVCTGNTCRSPMAEAFMNTALDKEPGLKESFRAASAGISAYPRDRATAHSINVMLSEWQIDISGHTASLLDKKDIEEAFLIFTMTRHQKDYILAQYPGSAGKTYSLKEFTQSSQDNNIYRSGTGHDITDPYGRSLHIYRQCAGEIKKAVDSLLDIITRQQNFHP